MWEWVSRPFRSRGEAAMVFVLTLIASLAWSMLMSTTLRPMLKYAGEGFFDPTIYGWAMVPLVGISVTVEEILRLAPLALMARLSPRNPAPVLGTAVVTAAVFGAAHVSNGLPLLFVLLCQGVVGFVMNLLFLKAGGLHRRAVRGFFYALAFHFTFDMVILVPVLLVRTYG